MPTKSRRPSRSDRRHGKYASDSDDDGFPKRDEEQHRERSPTLMWVPVETVEVNRNPLPLDEESQAKMDEYWATRREMKNKQVEAIKDVLLESEKEFNELCSKHDITDVEKLEILKKFVEIVDKRIQYFGVSTTTTISSLVMQYRCKFSVTKDHDMVTHLFNTFLTTRSKGPELTVTSFNSFRMQSILSAVLPEFNLAPLADEAEMETQEENISETANALDTTKKHYTINRDGFYVNITIDLNRQKKYYLTIKRLLKDLKYIIRKYSSYLELELFVYIITGIYEAQITDILKEQRIPIKHKELYNLYRTFHPPAEDEYFVLQTLYDIWDGLHNDPLQNSNGTSKSSNAKVKLDVHPSQSESTMSDSNILADTGNVA